MSSNDRQDESTGARGAMARRPRLLLLGLLLPVLLTAPVLLATGGAWASGTQAAPVKPTPTAGPVVDRTPQTVTVRRGDLVSSIPASGSVASTRQAQLSFGIGGRLAELKVAVGDMVSVGQPLAVLETQGLESSVARAESALRVSKLKLEQAQQGATPEERAVAEAAVEAAMAKYRDATAGPSKTELQAAQNALEHATAAVAVAEARLEQVKLGASEGAIAAAQADVDRSRASLTSAEAKLARVKAGPTEAERAAGLASLEDARADLARAEAKFERAKGGPTLSQLADAQADASKAKTALISAQDRHEMAQDGNLEGAGGTSNSAVYQAFETAKANYDLAVRKLSELQSGPAAADIQTAESELESARQRFNAAAARVAQMRQGPVELEVVAAQQTLDAARAALKSDEARMALLKAGPTEAEVLSAQGSLASARASLAKSQATLDELRAGPKDSSVQSARSSLVSAEAQLALKAAGPDATGLALLEEQVKQAEISLRGAKRELESATLVAPFAGIVAAVGANVGELVRGADAMVTLVDLKAVRVDVTVDESNLARLSPGQRATVSIEALEAQDLPGKVLSVLLVGNRQQKGVSYPVSVGIDAPERTVPTGMSAKVNIETLRKENVLLLPNTALRGQMGSRTVEVMADGLLEDRQVQIGSSNELFTEIVSGLDEGDLVVIRPPSTARPR